MKNLEKLLCLESITRKDLKEEGFSDYEIRKLVLEGVIEKTGIGIYASKSDNEKNTFKKLVMSIKNYDLDEFTKIYDNLTDKGKYSDDIVKLLLTALSKSLNIPNKDYELQHNEQLDNTNASEKIIEEDNDNIENDKEIESSIDKDDFDIDIFLNDLYDEYINAKEDKDYYKARDILLKYDYYCREYNIEFNCFNDLYKLTNNINKLNYDEETNDKITSLIHEIIECLKKKDASKNKEKIEILLNEFKTIPNYNNIYYYHRLKGDYFKLFNKFTEAKKEYKKAIEINPYNKQDYYFLARMYFYMVYSKSDCKNALKYIDKFIYYNDSTLTPNQLSHLVNIYIFNFKSYEAMEILDKIEDFDIDYKNEFYKNFVSLYKLKYEILKEVQFENDHAKTFFDNDYLDYFNEYVLMHSGNIENIFAEDNDYQYQLKQAEMIIDSDSSTKLNDLDEYLLKLDANAEEKANIILYVSVYLTEKGFYDKASSYLKIIEKMKKKSASLKENLIETRGKIKIRKIANKNRR